MGDLDSISGLGRSPGEGNGYTLQYSYLDNSIGKESVRKGWKRLVQQAHWQPVINRTTVILEGFVIRVALRSELQLCMLC